VWVLSVRVCAVCRVRVCACACACACAYAYAYAYAYACACVRVCACACERQRERPVSNMHALWVLFLVFVHVPRTCLSPTVGLCMRLCVYRVRKYWQSQENTHPHIETFTCPLTANETRSMFSRGSLIRCTYACANAPLPPMR
jgi:hypothetical protein